MNSRKYEIKTIDDILNAVTPENKENFVKDFSNWLDICLSTDGIVKALGGVIEMRKFIWIDDGKFEKTVHLEIRVEK